MVALGAKVLDVGCGDGELLRLLAETRGVDGRGIELSREGVNECVAKGLAVMQGDADTDLSDYPDDAFDYVILSQRCRRRDIPASCSSTCCASGGTASCRSRISAIGASAFSSCWAGICRTDNLPYAWWDRPISISAPSRISASSATWRGAKMEKAVALNAWGGAAPQRAVVVLEPARRAGGVPAEPAIAEPPGRHRARITDGRSVRLARRRYYRPRRSVTGVHHLGIDAAIAVTEAFHQRVRDREVADAGVGIDVGRRAAHDRLEDLEPRALPIAISCPTRSNSRQAGQPVT